MGRPHPVRYRRALASRLLGATHFDWYFRAPDGEGYEAAASRADAWLKGLRGPVIAVSHGLFGRLIGGAYLGLPHREALRLPVPQNVIWRLRDEAIEPIEV
ncbi:MAG TPA: hypothetical protein VFC47_00245 [Caulobacteraceae bacterium]|nr:hypothetical protein [Caulobacteraceae bacterium]